MQVPFHASACLLLTVFFDASRTLLDTSWSPAEFSWSAVEDSHRFISAIADSAHLPHVQNWTLDFNWETPSAATSLAKPPIKDQQSPHAICGLGSCATARLSNLALFIMQVPFHASACLLLTVFFDASRTLLDTSWSPAEFSWSAVEDSHRFISAIADSAHLPHVQNWTLDFNWETPSAATSLAKPPIKDQQSPHAICGLGSCATARLSNLALFIMQYLLQAKHHLATRLPRADNLGDAADAAQRTGN
ncbi:uncharacterized protein [Dermacentor albipictus]|uniref:uncharacterized protein n=1 Tax=Dermacentor albipictus TaxID=60249 RepID=UPI0031FE3AA2